MNKEREIEGYLKHLSVDKLITDKSYQRDQSKKLVNRMAKKWTDNYFRPPAVSQRGVNRYAVIDGGHTVAALQKRGYKGEVPCWVLPVKNIKEEADSFIGINDKTNHLGWNDKFIALCRSGDKKAIALKEVLDEQGIGVRKGEKPINQTIRSMSAVYRYFNPDELREVLMFVNRHWPDNKKRLGGYILTAFKRFSSLLQEERGHGLLHKDTHKQFDDISWNVINKNITEAVHLYDCARAPAARVALIKTYNYRRQQENRLPIEIS